MLLLLAWKKRQSVNYFHHWVRLPLPEAAPGWVRVGRAMNSIQKQRRPVPRHNSPQSRAEPRQSPPLCAALRGGQSRAAAQHLRASKFPNFFSPAQTKSLRAAAREVEGVRQLGDVQDLRARGRGGGRRRVVRVARGVARPDAEAACKHSGWIAAQLIAKRGSRSRSSWRRWFCSATMFSVCACSLIRSFCVTSSEPRSCALMACRSEKKQAG